jgi:hypothetical protein
MRVVALLALASGCGGEETDAPVPTQPEPPPSCEAPAQSLPDGSCIRPGVPPDGCSEGFEHDGSYGCEPVLPAESCPAGLMAVPGDSACRPLMECAQGKWGELPVDASTEYVDAAFGGISDGSATMPWSTIVEAVAAAAPGALIAVAAGRYDENVVIDGKAVRLWGVCPEQVTIAAPSQGATPCPAAAVCVVDDAHNTEIGGLSLTGLGYGIIVSGSENLLVDSVRVHDNARRAIIADNSRGVASIEVRNALIEQNQGVYFQGVDGTLTGSVVRNESEGGLIVAATCADTPSGHVCSVAASANVTRSVIENNQSSGVTVSGSHLNLSGSIVRGTTPASVAGSSGIGIFSLQACGGTPDDQMCDLAFGSTTTITGSLIENNQHAGVFISASDATLETTVVRTTLPNDNELSSGRGVNAQLGCWGTPAGLQCSATSRASLSLVSSLVENNHHAGLHVTGSDLTMDNSVVRQTIPNAGTLHSGRGISAQLLCFNGPTGQQCDPATSATASVRGSLIADNHNAGLFVGGSQATVDSSIVRTTLATDAFGGDGIMVLTNAAAASATIHGTSIEQSTRAGLTTFGASVSLSDSQIGCAAFALTGEPHFGSDFTLEDGGNNSCGCDGSYGACKLVSVGLAPPAAESVD